MKTYQACSALSLDDWRPGFTRVIFRPEHGVGGPLAIELPGNMYRAVCGGTSCGGKTLADFAPLFKTGLVRWAPTDYADYYTRGRIVLGETSAGTDLTDAANRWELDEWIAAQPVARRRHVRAAARTWTKFRDGDGRYGIRGADGRRLPGLAIGGGRRWAAELAGRTIGHYPSASAACRALFEAAAAA